MIDPAASARLERWKLSLLDLSTGNRLLSMKDGRTMIALPGVDPVRLAFRLAFWHARHTRSWRDAVVDVASRGGDADTNAAIVGALLGARDGAEAIPAAWRERVLGATLPGPETWAEAHHPRHLLALV